MKNPEKILVIDDEQTVATSIQGILEKEGYDVAIASNGQEALDCLQNGPFDLVLTDLVMGGIDGLDLIERIHRLAPDIIVMIITGYASLDSAIEALKMGAYDYLTKPCEIDDLVTKIEGAGDKKDAVEQKDMEDRIRKIIESPSSALDMVRRRKKDTE